MDILPAIDLRDAKVVRLSQGDYQRQTTYSDDPAAVAKQFVSAGAKWIHIVDLDAAKTGRRTNTAAIAAIHSAVSAKLEVGGGARDDASIERMLESGASRVVIGSAAFKNWKWFEGLLAKPELAPKLALGLDARDGMLAAHGWTAVTELRALDLAARVKGSLLGAIVYTDISRDGMLGGVNISATTDVVNSTDVPVIASGGVGSIDDVIECKRIGCGGVIIGRAWYEGKIDLAQAIAKS